jgi:hypothetical protein
MRLASQIILSVVALAASAGAAAADPCCGPYRRDRHDWLASAYVASPVAQIARQPAYVAPYGRAVYAEPTARTVYFNEPAPFDGWHGRAIYGRTPVCGPGCLSAAY